MNRINRVPTGILGLDDMIEGGLPIPSLTLIAGDVGAGKTTFCNQFLFKGAEQGEPGLYFLTYGGPSEMLFEYASTYEFVERTYFGDRIHYIDLESNIENARKSEDVLDALLLEVDKYKPTRIAIENISVLKDVLKGDYLRFLFKLANLIKAKKATALITSDSNTRETYPLQIAKVVDGIILLKNEEVNLTRRRSIQILKMCATSHHLARCAVDISAKGLVVYPGL